MNKEEEKYCVLCGGEITTTPYYYCDDADCNCMCPDCFSKIVEIKEEEKQIVELTIKEEERMIERSIYKIIDSKLYQEQGLIRFPRGAESLGHKIIASYNIIEKLADWEPYTHVAIICTEEGLKFIGLITLTE